MTDNENKPYTITGVTLDDLRRMVGREGLILQGCGGDLGEWVEGINETLTEAEILTDGSIFKNISVFEHEGLTNLLFHMDDEPRLDVGKLAMWRLQTRDNFGGVWLSDYQVNSLGMDIEAPATEASASVEKQKPQAPLIGADGNVFNILGIAARTLKRNGMADAAKEMQTRVTSSHSYDEALAIIMDYVEPVSQEEMQGGGMEMRM
jgi:hypothetical protein